MGAGSPLKSLTFWLRVVSFVLIGGVVAVPGALIGAALYAWIRQAAQGERPKWSDAGPAIKTYFWRLYWLGLLLVVLDLMRRFVPDLLLSLDESGLRWYYPWHWTWPVSYLLVCLVPYALVGADLRFWHGLRSGVLILFRRFGTLLILWVIYRLVWQMLSLDVWGLSGLVRSHYFVDPTTVLQAVTRGLIGWPFVLLRAILGLFLAMAFMLIVIEERERTVPVAQVTGET